MGDVADGVGYLKRHVPQIQCGKKSLEVKSPKCMHLWLHELFVFGLACQASLRLVHSTWRWVPW